MISRDRYFQPHWQEINCHRQRAHHAESVLNNDLTANPDSLLNSNLFAYFNDPLRWNIKKCYRIAGIAE